MGRDWRAGFGQLAIALFLGGVTVPAGESIVSAQIIPDETLGDESSVVTVDNIKGLESDRISGGAARGSNLFHSFQEFNIGEGRGGYFENPEVIENIFSRVTGSNPSEILGRLGVLGDANLFFLNPNGIIFGENASLDLNGSFLATTADSIVFPDGNNFSATNPEAAPLLTVNVQQPIGLEFQGKEGIISNQGNLAVGEDFTLSAGNLDLQGQLQTGGGSVTLLANNNITTSDIYTLSNEGNAGAITLNAANGNINIAGDLNSRTFTTSGNTGKAGAISLNAPQGSINLTGNLSAYSFNAGLENTFNAKDGGDITLYAGNDINIQGNVNSYSNANRGNTENAGKISLNTTNGSINVAGNLKADSSTDNLDHTAQAGDGGDITLNAANSIDLQGDVYSFSSANYSSTGNGGAISLTASNGSIEIQGMLNTYSRSYIEYGQMVSDANIGNGGAVTLEAGDNIDITGSISSNTLLGSFNRDIIQTGNVGNGGTVKLTASNGIKVTGGISSNTDNVNNYLPPPIDINDINTIISYVAFINSIKDDVTTGSGGAVTLSASNGNIETGGIYSSAKARYGDAGNSGAVIIEAANGSILGEIDSRAEVSFGGSGDGGAVNLTASRDIETSIISYSSSATGNSGNGGTIELTSIEGDIKAGSLSSYSLVNYTGNSSNAGEITLAAPKGSITTGDVLAFSSPSILYDFFPASSERGASINLTAKEDVTTGSLLSYGGSESGNITVNTTGAFSAANSIISTTTNGPSRSGDIEIRAKSVALTDGTQVSTSTTTQGKGGNLSIIAPDFVTLSGSSPEIVRLFWTEQGLFAAPGSSVKLSGYIPPLDFSRQFGEVAFPTGIYTQTSGQNSDAGNAGTINIKTGELLVQDRAVIAATTFGSGDGGDIFVEANNINVRNGSLLSGVGPQAAGDSGKIDIQSRFLNKSSSLDLSEQGVLQTLTLGGGKAGSIEIAMDSISVTNEAQISASTLEKGKAGNIEIDTPQLIIDRGASISAFTEASGDSGTITVNAPQAVLLTENSKLTVETTSAGKPGNIFIATPHLTIGKDAEISATATQDSTNTEGGGTITVKASKLDLTGKLGIFAETKGEAPAGTLTIQPDNHQPELDIQFTDTAIISSSTTASGSGGDINLNAPETINISGKGQVIVETKGSGDAGSINIETKDLNISNQTEISASTFSLGKAGDINITAANFNLLKGAELFTDTTSGVSAGDIQLNITDSINLSGSNIRASTTLGSMGNGGNIFIDPATMIVQDGAKIAVNSSGSGVGGNIDLQAGSLTLDKGTITAETASNQGGNINLTLSDLLTLRNNSQITATAGTAVTAEAKGDGGNITINTPFIVSFPFENNDITANASFGNGGRVEITSQGIFGIEFRDGETDLSDITVSSEFGQPGEVEINTSAIDPTRGLNNLPQEAVEAEVAQGCQTVGGKPTLEFFDIGRGGLPPTPEDLFSSEIVIAEWISLDLAEEKIQASTSENSFTEEEVKNMTLLTTFVCQK